MKLLRIKFIANVFFTITFIVFTVNMFLPTSLEFVEGNYWPWLVTSSIIVVERWVIFFVFEDKAKNLKSNRKEEKKNILQMEQDFIDLKNDNNEQYDIKNKEIIVNGKDQRENTKTGQ